MLGSLELNRFDIVLGEVTASADTVDDLELPGEGMGFPAKEGLSLPGEGLGVRKGFLDSPMNAVTTPQVRLILREHGTVG